MSIPVDSNVALATIAELAGRGFPSVAAAIDVILPAMTSYLACRASLITRIVDGVDQVHIVAASQDSDGVAIAPDNVFVPAIGERAFWFDTTATTGLTPITTPLVGYAVSAPICREDGTCWGLLVVLATQQPTWTPTQAFVMRVCACRLADELARQHKREHDNALKGDFVSIVSHEFRTALMSILGFSQILRDETSSSDETHEYAADIFNDATRISRMITDMLDLDRIESGRITLTIAPVDLNHLLHDMLTRFAATQSDHTLRLQLDPTLPQVVADNDKIVQIIANLLSNAIKYSPKGGEIVLGSTTEVGVAHLWVRDQGMGIPPDAIERIFERYARVEAETSRYIQGTGLGLPIVRQLAQMHGGNAWAESTLGTGSTFHVTLPLTPTSAHAA